MKLYLVLLLLIAFNSNAFKCSELGEAPHQHPVKPSFTENSHEDREKSAELGENGGISTYYRDCLEALENGMTENGVYTIKVADPQNGAEFNITVYCDMETDGGGWTVRA